MRDNVRLHLDQVARLGDFGEVEAVIADGDDPEHSRGAVDEILAALGVAPSDLIDVSYFEMLAKPLTSRRHRSTVHDFADRERHGVRLIANQRSGGRACTIAA